jgi:hypothetical protein
MNRSAPDEQPWNSSDSKPGFWSMALRGFQTASGFASLVVNTGIDIARFPAKFLAAASDGWLGKPREQGYALIGNVREIFSLEEKKASAETDESNIDLDNVKYDDSKSVNEAMLKLFFDIRKYLGGLWRKSN